MPLPADIVDRLRAHRQLRSIPPEEIAWLAAHGRYVQYEEEEVVSSPEIGVTEEMMIVLSGRISVRMERGGVSRRVIDWVGGDITGRLPYSRQKGSVAMAYAEDRAQAVTVHVSQFPEMIRECPELTAKVVHQMVDRARAFTRHDLHAEKMMSLGRLAAGLAHELHNPASAMLRTAKLLVPLLEESDAAAQVLGSRRLPPEQAAAIHALANGRSGARDERSPLAAAREEEAIIEWLEGRGLDDESAEALAEAAVPLAALDDLAGAVDPAALESAVRWIATARRARGLAADIAEGAARISKLVDAVKGFTHLDAAAVPEPLDLEDSIRRTLAMLAARERDRRATVRVAADPELPPVIAVGAELNQVWFHLLENAFDAIAEGGSIEVVAGRKGREAVVHVVDDGPGIPPEVGERVFDPFFTTKPVGQGTGLGLDVVRRLVLQHGGEIDFSSEPGRTEFRVRLPIEGEAEPA